MKFSEFDLEQAIWDDYINTGGMKLEMNGLKIQPLMKRQFKIGNYGVADLVGFEMDNGSGHRVLNITVYELKKDSINFDTLKQITKYIKGLDSMFCELQIELRIDGVMIGSNVDTSDWIYITNMIDDIHCCIVNLDVDGLVFEYQSSNYSLVDEGNMSKHLTFSDYKKLLT